jgi:hypothetical protein
MYVLLFKAPVTVKSEPTEDLAADFYITTNDGEMNDASQASQGSSTANNGESLTF